MGWMWDVREREESRMIQFFGVSNREDGVVIGGEDCGRGYLVGGVGSSVLDSL